MPSATARSGPIDESERSTMADVIERAFGSSLGVFLPDRAARLRVIADGVNLNAAIGGYRNGELVGVIGFKTARAAVFDGMTFDLLRRELGAGAIRARSAVALMNRPLESGIVRIEFVAVAESARRHGVGTSMLQAIDSIACAAGARMIELHVEPGNLEAQRFYRRAGFQVAPAVPESFVRRILAPQTDRRMIKELACTTS